MPEICFDIETIYINLPVFQLHVCNIFFPDSANKCHVVQHLNISESNPDSLPHVGSKWSTLAASMVCRPPNSLAQCRESLREKKSMLTPCSCREQQHLECSSLFCWSCEVWPQLRVTATLIPGDNKINFMLIDCTVLGRLWRQPWQCALQNIGCIEWHILAWLIYLWATT